MVLGICKNEDYLWKTSNFIDMRAVERCSSSFHLEAVKMELTLGAQLGAEQIGDKHPKMSFSSWCLQGLQWLTQKCRFGPWILESAPWICQPWMITHIPLTSSPSPPLTSPAFPPLTMKISPLPELSSQAWITNMISSSRIAKVSSAFFWSVSLVSVFPSFPGTCASSKGIQSSHLLCQQRCSCRADRKGKMLPAELHPARAAAGAEERHHKVSKMTL